MRCIRLDIKARRHHRYYHWQVVYEPGGPFASAWQVGMLGELAKVEHILHGPNEWRIGHWLYGRVPITLQNLSTRVDALWNLYTFTARN